MAIANTQNPRQIGTGFTNLQQIMNANQGNKLGQAVGSGIQKAGEQVQQGLQQGQQDFQTQSQSSQLGTQGQKENVENVLKDPTKATDQDVSNFSRYRSGAYTGPQDISNIDTLRGQATQAQQLGQAVGSEGGRQALLQRYAAGPGSYTGGQQRLDTLLLGTQGGQPLQAARRSVSGLTGQLSGASQAAQQQAQQYGQQAKGFGQQVTEQTGAAESGVYNPAQQAAQAANIAEQKGLSSEQAAAQAAQEGNLSQEALTALGLQAGQRTYGANLGQYLGYTPQNQQATALNQMTQPQFQQYSSLQKLMGQTPSSAPQTPYQAGKATFDQSGAQGAVGQAQQAYQGEFNPVISNLNSQFGANYQNIGQVQAAADQLRKAASTGSPWIRGPAAEALSRMQPQLSKLQDIENRYGGLANLMTPTTPS